MPIAVICPGCRAQFRVHEKFAGKEGPCPKCKAKITIPLDDVKIHVPEEAVPTTAGGKPVTATGTPRPVARTKRELKVLPALIIGGATIGVLVVAWLGGDLIQNNAVARIVGLLAVSLPLAVAGYSVLRDDELEPYRGQELLLRAALCAAGYALLWGVFWYLPDDAFRSNLNWLFIAPPFVLVGAGIALGCFDLPFQEALLHYAFYVLASLALRWLVGMPPMWDILRATQQTLPTF
jgi:hypothetical protein